MTNYVRFENKVLNPSFEDNTQGWVASGGNIARDSAHGVTYGSWALGIWNYIPSGNYGNYAVTLKAYHHYYLSMTATRYVDDGNYIASGTVFLGATSRALNNDANTNRYSLTRIIGSSDEVTNIGAYVQVIFGQSGGVFIDSVVLLDLTEIFASVGVDNAIVLGTGNEPNINDMDSIFQYFLDSNQLYAMLQNGGISSIDMTPSAKLSQSGNFEVGVTSGWTTQSLFESTAEVVTIAPSGTTFSYNGGNFRLQQSEIFGTNALKMYCQPAQYNGNYAIFVQNIDTPIGHRIHYRARGITGSAFPGNVSAKIIIANSGGQSGVSAFDNTMKDVWCQIASSNTVTSQLYLQIERSPVNATNDAILVADGILAFDVTESYGAFSSVITAQGIDCICAGAGNYWSAVSEKQVTIQAPVLTYSAGNVAISITYNYDNNFYFQIWRSIDGGTYIEVEPNYTSDTYLDTDVIVGGHSYSYKIRSVNDDGYVALNFSNIVTGYTWSLPTPPTSVICTNGIDGLLHVGVDISWSGATNGNTGSPPGALITGYNIYLKNAVTGNVPALIYSVSGMNDFFLYYYNYGGSPHTFSYQEVCYFSVKALSDIGESSSSSYTTITILPLLPVGLEAIATVSGGNPALAVDWRYAASTSATTFNVFRSNTLGGTYSQINASPITYPTKNYLDINLPGDTTFYYKVEAVISGVGSGRTAPASGTTFIVPVLTNIVAQRDNVFKDRLTVSWTATNTNSVDIFIYKNVSGNISQVTQASTQGLSKSFTDIPYSYDGTTECYMLINANGTNHTTGYMCGIANPPFAPTLTDVVPHRGTVSITLDWTAPSYNGGLNITTQTSISSYNIYRGASPGTILYYTNTTGLTYTDNLITVGATYYYLVVAVNDAGLSGALSSYLSTVVHPRPTLITYFKAINTIYRNKNIVRLEWQPSEYTEGYRVYHNTVPSIIGWTYRNQTSLDTAYYDEVITPNTTHYYWVYPYYTDGGNTYLVDSSSGYTSIQTPDFTYPGLQSGTGGWTLYATKGITPTVTETYTPDPGHPQNIITTTTLTDGHPSVALEYSTAQPSGTLVPQMQVKGGGWQSVQNVAGTTFTFDKLQFSQTYLFRVVVFNSLQQVIASTNTISITTYNPDSSYFPNLFPNAGLQYGFYTDNGTLESIGYRINKPSIQQSPIHSTFGEAVIGFAKNYSFYSGKGLVINQKDGVEGVRKFVRNKAVIKLPLPAIGRRLWLGFRGVTDIDPTIINGEGQSRICVRAANLGSIDYFSGAFIGTGLGDAFVTNASLPSSGYGTLFGAIVYPFTNAQIQYSQVQFQFSNDGAAADLSIYLGDFFLFDLSAVFGGEGHNILDGSANITSEMIIAAVNAGGLNWWDFDYKGNALPPINSPITKESNNVFEIDIVNCYDDAGGMDKSGYLPISSYDFAYRQWKDLTYIDIGVDVFSDSVSAIHQAQLNLLPESTYQTKYMYLNTGGFGNFSAPSTLVTPDLASMVGGVSLSTYYKNSPFTGASLTVNWTLDTLATNYNIYIGTDPLSLTKVANVGNVATYTFGAPTHPISTGVYINYNTVYYVQVSGVNIWGEGPKSYVTSLLSVTDPTAPLNPEVIFKYENANKGVVYFAWDAPTHTGGPAIVNYIVTYQINDNTPITVDAGNALTYPAANTSTIYANKGDTIYVRVAAENLYTQEVSHTVLYSITASSTFIIITEYLKIRGYADTEGYMQFYFTARDTFAQAEDTYWVFCNGIINDPFKGYIPGNFPQGTTLASLQNYITQPNRYIFQVPTSPTTTSTWPSNWPYFVESYGTTMGNDLLGDYLLLTLNTYPINGDSYDVHTSLVGFDGFNSLMIITDYTSDIQYSNSLNDSVGPTDINTNATGSIALIWTINAALENDATSIPGDDIPRTVNYFYMPVVEGDTLKTIGNHIKNGWTPPGGSHVPSLEKQINNYYVNVSPLRSLYQSNSISGTHPFSVVVTATTVSNVNHLRVNITAYLESIENQITMQAQNLYAFYISTKPNTYFINESIYELRSYDDMYGRNKPGSSTISGYTKRSYGFRFPLDIITAYTDEEASPVDVTAIPGMSTAYNIGLDTTGPSRNITIEGVRVDNMNTWMFNAPYDYIVNPGKANAIATGGVMYIGTSNWGWIKFMKAAMGTFQFIDGPYRLVIMTIPSSAMQQYVLNRQCKYQYSDGTLIIQVGFEDMCYVMMNNFQVRKNNEMTNAIEYTLRLNRVLPLGSSP